VSSQRVGGIFVGSFLLFGAVQAVTGFIPAMPSVASALPQKPRTSASYKFTGTSAPVKAGSLPKARWEELMNKWGNLCPALTPALLAGQLHQESMGFKQSVIDGDLDSPAGAKGMAQFMDATWARYGIDANKDGRKNKYDPEDAIPSAAVYDCKVASYVKNVTGSKSSNMLAAYNAGPGAVKKYGGIPPYRETQDYVRIIKQKAARYER